MYPSNADFFQNEIKKTIFYNLPRCQRWQRPWNALNSCWVPTDIACCLVVLGNHWGWQRVLFACAHIRKRKCVWVCMCVCVCMGVCMWEREKDCMRKTHVCFLLGFFWYDWNKQFYNFRNHHVQARARISHLVILVILVGLCCITATIEPSWIVPLQCFFG